MKLAMTDLKPQTFSFQLSTHGEKKYTLRVFSLAEQIWCDARFGPSKVKEIFEERSIAGIAEIAHHLLEDSSDFPTFMDFAKSIVTFQDKIAVVQGLLTTVGISQPVIEKLAKQVEAETEQTPLPKPEAQTEQTQPIGPQLTT